MQMRTIIIHHLQPCWGAGYASHGTSFIEQLQKVLDHLYVQEYDRVILTLFDEWKLPDCLQALTPYHPEVHEYGYGWEPEMFRNEDDYCPGGDHSAVVATPDWMRALPQDNLFICGAFDGQCIEDLEVALEYLGKAFTRLDALIV